MTTAEAHAAVMAGKRVANTEEGQGEYYQWYGLPAPGSIRHCHYDLAWGWFFSRVSGLPESDTWFLYEETGQ